jgi:hypothetical protein
MFICRSICRSTCESQCRLNNHTRHRCKLITVAMPCCPHPWVRPAGRAAEKGALQAPQQALPRSAHAAAPRAASADACGVGARLRRRGRRKVREVWPRGHTLLLWGTGSALRLRRKDALQKPVGQKCVYQRDY